MTSQKTETIGAIWKGTTQKGMEKLSIQIDIDGKTYRFTAFPNTFKSLDKHPDYRILPPQEVPVATKAQNQPATDSVTASTVAAPDDFDPETDIPF